MREKRKIYIRIIIFILYLLILIWVFVNLILINVNPIIVILIVSFLFLLGLGPIISGFNKEKLSRIFPSFKNRKISIIPKSTQQVKVKHRKINLNTNYQKSLIQKCQKCGMTLISSLNKCPNCGTKLIKV